jgi:hypothetical protein
MHHVSNVGLCIADLNYPAIAKALLHSQIIERIFVVLNKGYFTEI